MSVDTSNTHRVAGMSCGGCEAAVRTEVEKVSGVETVDVDLGSKEVVVHARNATAPPRK